MKVIDQVVHAIMEMCNEKGWVIHEFSEVMENLRIIKVKLDKSDLAPEFQVRQNKETLNYKMYLNAYHKKCYHHWRPEDIRRVGIQHGAFKGFNTGGLLWGEAGCGKSQILAYLTAWAHENQWVNLTIPSCKEFIDASHDIERMENGLYVQYTLATRLLSDLAYQNESIFNELDVDMNLYGKMDFSGAKDTDGEPCPRVWDEQRQCWSDEWKQFIYDVEYKELDNRYKLLAYRISDKCKDPKKIMDIVKAGKEDPLLATCAIAEILEQLYNQDKVHVLACLDGFNHWVRPSYYDSFRYANYNFNERKIPPRDLSLVRMFYKFDGHHLRQGAKFMTTDHYNSFNHVMKPETIDWFDGYSHRVN